jgi:REP element-mobilizing transposase RayT
MGRPLRITTGGLVYHVLNRANVRMGVFDTADDYAAFERILEEAVERVKMRLLAYCVMPNHWHLVVRPRRQQTSHVRELARSNTRPLGSGTYATRKPTSPPVMVGSR